MSMLVDLQSTIAKLPKLDINEKAELLIELTENLEWETYTENLPDGKYKKLTSKAISDINQFIK